ncbi:hypothetical protein GOP47_0010127 [Adiantum capillus-veneris]|uniref:Uncharacterized protein n=1 Tax=Adiantum capillus-veneris TaxID=13818 RepID=A0A9D4UU79_ADICA|nr:hypothetical protein GOP47_0010127 [Adiantum capillus-veneris]
MLIAKLHGHCLAEAGAYANHSLTCPVLQDFSSQHHFLCISLFAYLMTFGREAWLTYATLVPVVAGVVIASGVCNGCMW